MKKYKICPLCGKQNNPDLLECLSCETDLTGVKITDEENEKNEVFQEKGDEFVRVCDCGFVNPPNARKCQSCGEDISDVSPTKHTLENTIEDTSSYILSSLDGEYAFQLSNTETVIGREAEMSEYLSSKIYVSRIHARIVVEEGLFIENLSKTNHTYVNNSKITQKAKLSDGDEIGLGGNSINGKRQNEAAYFMVRIGKCM